MAARHDTLLQAALGAGAQKAAMISQAQIVLSAEFRSICAQNGCGHYGRCWMCPPDVGDIQTLMAKVRRYPYGLMYQTVGSIEDGFDVEGMTARAAEHAQISQRVQAALTPLLPPGFTHLTCGGCRLCDDCAKRLKQPCRRPGQALASLEGYGVDVYQTVKHTELRYINGENTVTFFGMVLFGA